MGLQPTHTLSASEMRYYTRGAVSLHHRPESGIVTLAQSVGIVNKI